MIVMNDEEHAHVLANACAYRCVPLQGDNLRPKIMLRLFVLLMACVHPNWRALNSIAMCSLLDSVALDFKVSCQLGSMC